MTAATTAYRGSARPSLWARTPSKSDDWFDDEQLAEMRAYFKPLRRLRIVGSVLSTAVIAVFAFGDFGVRIADAAGGGWFLQLVAVLAVLMLVSELVTLPISIYVDLDYDKRHGLSTITPRQFAIDQVKDYAIYLLLTAVLLGVVFAAIRAFELWWFIAWAGFMAIQIVMVLLYPVLIMPRFNKFTPLEDGALRTRIEEVAVAAGTQIEGIYTMDASRRSRRGNAFVAGWGPSKRVVLFDTILAMPSESIAQIVAHEIGHYRLKHTVKSLPFRGALLFASFLVVDVVASNDSLLRWTGASELGDPASLPLFLLAFGVASTLLGIAGAWWDRYQERAADLEALEVLGNPTEFIGVWPRFVTLNKAELEPSWWARQKHSHPEVAERMQFGLSWADLNGVAVSRPAKAKLDDPFAAARKDVPGSNPRSDS